MLNIRNWASWVNPSNAFYKAVVSVGATASSYVLKAKSNRLPEFTTICFAAIAIAIPQAVGAILGRTLERRLTTRGRFSYDGYAPHQFQAIRDQGDPRVLSGKLQVQAIVFATLFAAHRFFGPDFLLNVQNGDRALMCALVAHTVFGCIRAHRLFYGSSDGSSTGYLPDTGSTEFSFEKHGKLMLWPFFLESGRVRG